MEYDINVGMSFKNLNNVILCNTLVPHWKNEKQFTLSLWFVKNSVLLTN